MVKAGSFTVHRRRTCLHQKEHLFDWAYPSSGQLRPVKRDPCLVATRCPPEVGFQLTGFLEIGNSADSGNDSGCLDVPNRRNGEQDLSLAAIGHDSAYLCLQEAQVFLNKPQFFEKEGLFEEESLQPVNIFGAYRLAGKLLEFEKVCVRGKVSRSERSQSREAGRGKC